MKGHRGQQRSVNRLHRLQMGSGFDTQMGQLIAKPSLTQALPTTMMCPDRLIWSKNRAIQKVAADHSAHLFSLGMSQRKDFILPNLGLDPIQNVHNLHHIHKTVSLLP
jgi:hypothetical protein